MIAVVPISFLDQEGMTWTLYKRIVALPELNSIYLGVEFLYDDFFRFSDIEGLYLVDENQKICQIPYVWKKSTKSINLFCSDSEILYVST